MRLAPVTSVPEIRLYLAHPASGLRRLLEPDDGDEGRAEPQPPYWAYVWAGGAALARHILDRPSIVAGKRVLDLGAGSGRLAIPLARDGVEVVAVDRAPAMLERLRERVTRLPKAAARRVSVVEGDLRNFQITGKVDLVVAAFNTLEHLYTDDDVLACFRRVRACLEPGAAFAFDVQIPDLIWLERDPNKRWARTRYTDPHTRRAMIYSTNHDWDVEARISYIRLFYEPADGKGATKIVKLAQRKYFPSHLAALVTRAGFRMIARYADWGWQPLVLIGDDAPPVDGRVPESQVLVVIPDEKITISDEDLARGRSPTRKK